jgi:hypothetical protein
MGFLECAISYKHRDNALNNFRFDSPEEKRWDSAGKCGKKAVFLSKEKRIVGSVVANYAQRRCGVHFHI